MKVSKEQYDVLTEFVSKLEVEDCTSEKPKKINMSVCIESGIDCEFWEDNAASMIGQLDNIEEGVLYQDTLMGCHKHCRPRMNGHIHASPTGWDKCPLPEGFIIRVWDMALNDCGMTDYLKLDWTTLIMFEVTGIAEGYEL